MTLIVDPMHEAVDDLARIEEWLRWADWDDDELGQLLDRAAERAGALPWRSGSHWLLRRRCTHRRTWSWPRSPRCLQRP